MRIEVCDICEAGKRIGWAATDVPGRACRACVTDAGIEVTVEFSATHQLAPGQLADLPRVVELWQGLRRDLAGLPDFEHATWEMDPAEVLQFLRVHESPRDRGGFSEWADIRTPTGMLYAVVLRMPAGLDAILTGSKIHLARQLDAPLLRRFLTRTLLMPNLLSVDEWGAEFLVEVAALVAARSREARSGAGAHSPA